MPTIPVSERFTTYASPGYSMGMSRLNVPRLPRLQLPVHWLVAVLVVLLVLIQYPLWLGKGGWLRVADLDHKLREQQTFNKKLVARNSAMSSEVADLKNGLMAIEERARSELDLIKSEEIFVSIVGTNKNNNNATAPTSAVRVTR